MLLFTTKTSASKTEPCYDEVIDSASYLVDVEKSELLSRLAAFEETLKARNVPSFTAVADEEYMDIVLRDETPASLGGVMFWERLLGKEVIILDDLAIGQQETRVTINLVPEGTEEDPNSLNTSFSQKFVVPRRPGNVFETIAALEKQTREYIVFGCHRVSGSELLIVIHPEHHLAAKGLPYWEDIFSVHGGLQKVNNA